MDQYGIAESALAMAAITVAFTALAYVVLKCVRQAMSWMLLLVLQLMLTCFNTFVRSISPHTQG